MKHRFILSLALVGLCWGVAHGDISDTPQNGRVLSGPEFLSEPIDRQNDVDFFFVEVGANSQVYVSLQPTVDLDVSLRIHSAQDPSTIIFESDRVASNGTEQEVFLNSGSQTGYYLVSVISKGGLGSYDLRVDPAQALGAPHAIFLNKNTYRVGEPFFIQSGYTKLRDRDYRYDIYLTMEYAGTFYWYPGWGETVTSLANQEIQYGRYAVIQRELEFTAPTEFVGLGTFNFYAGVLERDSGYFSNIAHAPVTFLP